MKKKQDKKTIQLYFNSSDFEEIEKKAEEYGLPLAGFCRFLIKKSFGKGFETT